MLVLNCNVVQRKAFNIWCHDSTCGSSISGVTLPCYVELISYNVLELKFFFVIEIIYDQVATSSLARFYSSIRNLARFECQIFV